MRTSPAGFDHDVECGSDISPVVRIFIPAHNEEDRIAAAIRSATNQTLPPASVTVISDNSTDRTVEIASGWGSAVRCVETVNNRNMKAGALNQVLEGLDDSDETFVMVMDADSTLAPRFLERALEALADPEVGAVGGIFVGDGENGWLGAAQSLEYVRYAREIGRNGAAARVLTGTATIARLGTFREVARARAEGRLPGRGIYNLDALTEDFCITLAIRTLGYRTVSPKECLVTTETMPTVPMLWRQRVRWQRGAVQTLGNYGLTRVTAPYIGRQLVTGFGIFAMLALWVITGWSLKEGSFAIHPFWLVVGLVYQVERVLSAWRADWRGRVMAISMLPDMLFDLFIAVVYLWVIGQSVRRTRTTWGTSTIDSGHASGQPA